MSSRVLVAAMLAALSGCGSQPEPARPTAPPSLDAAAQAIGKARAALAACDSAVYGMRAAYLALKDLRDMAEFAARQCSGAREAINAAYLSSACFAAPAEAERQADLVMKGASEGPVLDRYWQGLDHCYAAQALGATN